MNTNDQKSMAEWAINNLRLNVKRSYSGDAAYIDLEVFDGQYFLTISSETLDLSNLD